MNAESFPDCRGVLDDVLSGATHSDFPPELLRRTLNANKVYLHNPFAIHEVCPVLSSLLFFSFETLSHTHTNTLDFTTCEHTHTSRTPTGERR